MRCGPAFQVTMDTSNWELNKHNNPPNFIRIAVIANDSNKELTWRPALAERETALALDLPESLPAFPPAFKQTN